MTATDPAPGGESVPRGKDARQRRDFARALARFSRVFYRNMRRHAQLLDQHTVQIQALQDAVVDLRTQLRQAIQRAEQAVRLYHDTHDTITGEHVDHGEGLATHTDPAMSHVDGGVFARDQAELDPLPVVDLDDDDTTYVPRQQHYEPRSDR